MSQSVIAPTKIGPYSLRGTIGEGAFSIVKLVYHEEKCEYYACKIVPKMRIMKGNLHDQFESEIRINQQLHHPGIVRIVDVLKDNFNYYVVLEFCSNGDLFQCIIDRSKLSEIDSKRYIVQILETLKYIHQVGVAHRDLKPENILIDQNGLLKLSDFGLSKFVNCDGLVSTPCGSPCYASPECIIGKPYDGKKNDVWSVGVIVYAMLTAQLPWTKRNKKQLFEQIVKGDYKIPAFLSDEATSFIKGMMCVDANQRITIEESLNHPFLHEASKVYKNASYMNVQIKLLHIRKIDKLFDIDTESFDNLDFSNNQEEIENTKSMIRVDYTQTLKTICKKVPHVYNRVMDHSLPAPIIEMTPSMKSLPPTPLELIAQARQRYLIKKPISLMSITPIKSNIALCNSQGSNIQYPTNLVREKKTTKSIKPSYSMAAHLRRLSNGPYLPIYPISTEI
ncbi:CAMK family protein kinase [Tritrichomonas foetus]|uniref:CAMK family protein kinase n=1 Tax=Tritrichomonas foetus TaxID=1144522 RepID=A0A1J4JLH1_9EUKA|nr:CAMK family protein kinase [Tritrichomonas foetus]|eukprot:OHS98397.1 CAMK family protein kinase [Tritrichomonas foetus]